MKGRYKGEEVILICNGPSLNNIDLSQIDYNRFRTMGLNNIIRFLDEIGLFLDFYLAADRIPYEESRDEIMKSKSHKFLRKALSDDQLAQSIRTQIVDTDIFLIKGNAFSFDPTEFVTGIAGAPYMAMQILYYLGFEKVYIIGMDHTIAADSHTSNHFTNKYFKDEKNSIAAFEKTKPMNDRDGFYKYALHIYRKSGRDIINCTEGSLCTVFRQESHSVLLKNELNIFK